MAGVTLRMVRLGVLSTINKVIYVVIQWSGCLGPISIFFLTKPFHFSSSVILCSLDSALERRSPSPKLWCGNHEIYLRNSNDPMLQVLGHLVMIKWEEVGKIQSDVPAQKWPSGFGCLSVWFSDPLLTAGFWHWPAEKQIPVKHFKMSSQNAEVSLLQKLYTEFRNYWMPKKSRKVVN